MFVKFTKKTNEKNKNKKTQDKKNNFVEETTVYNKKKLYFWLNKDSCKVQVHNGSGSFFKNAPWADGWLPSLLSPPLTFICPT